MKASKKSGFTLVEMLVSLSIFSITIALGYRVINKLNYTMNIQKEVTIEQLSINVINEIITKDLEESKDVALPSNADYNNNSYEYTIEKEDGAFVNYIIEKDNGTFTLSRQEKGNKIDLIINNKYTRNNPVKIEKDMNTFLVNIEYIKNNNKKSIYEFKATSRYGTKNYE